MSPILSALETLKGCTDALAGLKELLSLHGQLLSLHLGVILKPLAKLIADDDAGVRKSVLAFMDWLLPSVDYVRLKPSLEACADLSVTHRTTSRPSYLSSSSQPPRRSPTFSLKFASTASRRSTSSSPSRPKL